MSADDGPHAGRRRSWIAGCSLAVVVAGAAWFLSSAGGQPDVVWLHLGAEDVGPCEWLVLECTDAPGGTALPDVLSTPCFLRVPTPLRIGERQAAGPATFPARADGAAWVAAVECGGNIWMLHELIPMSG